MNFNVIDGTDVILPDELFPRFETDYLESHLTSVEVRKKYNLSKKQYSILTQKIRDKYGLLKRPYPNCKHYYRQGNRWVVKKTIEGEIIYFGSLPIDVFNADEMDCIVEKCKEMHWNIDKCKELLEVMGAD